jgi:uncharacterized protein (TIGR02145 family)
MVEFEMVKKIVLFILFFFYFGKLSAQEVKNIKVEQNLNKIIISYDLIASEQCKIDVFLSTDGGNTWLGPLSKVTGHVGNNINAGSNKIEWSVLDEYEVFQYNNVKFQIKAGYYGFRKVKIGWQTWAADNLNISSFRNGDLINEAKTDEEWIQFNEEGKPAWCYYGNDALLGKTFGRLYNWYAIADLRGLCPAGWIVPDDNDWTNLIDNLGGLENAGIYLKSVSGWKDNGNGKNSSGFNALPSGYRYVDGSFDMKGSYAYWWSSTSYFDTEAYDRDLNYYGSTINRGTFKKGYGFSVRCIKD